MYCSSIVQLKQNRYPTDGQEVETVGGGGDSSSTATPLAVFPKVRPCIYLLLLMLMLYKKKSGFSFFTSTENRHALPLFTSLLNCLCSYDPVGYGLPYNHLMFIDSREPLVEVALQVLCVTIENDSNAQPVSVDGTSGGTAMDQTGDSGSTDNLFLNYLSRIHREEDFAFILKGITRLLNNPLQQTYLPGSCKRIQFHQDSDVLDILVPILYNLNDARADQSRVGLMHIGVFILLLLSGERNFGVRLNKPYSVRVPMDIPVFTGSHADFLILYSTK
ncbi:protein HID1 [Biomphalaria pfeifferi]|uniref:Protein HID1 n=1 Tax=Biomphalaria pfeifferi TaxID=112525 RepID=A0AAD8FH47_BIOPF|nr:protein HID1 [Biomphalaria pfeifferi]